MTLLPIRPNQPVRVPRCYSSFFLVGHRKKGRPGETLVRQLPGSEVDQGVEFGLWKRWTQFRLNLIQSWAFLVNVFTSPTHKWRRNTKCAVGKIGRWHANHLDTQFRVGQGPWRCTACHLPIRRSSKELALIHLRF